MLTAVDVATGPGVRVKTVTCRDDHTGWSQPETRDGYNLVMVRRGRFRRRVDGTSTDLDPTMAYLGEPGAEEQFAHPAGGDLCTWIRLQPALWTALDGAATTLAQPAFYVHARLDLNHRRLLAAARAGDVGYAMMQGILDLLTDVLAQVGAGASPAHSPARPQDRALVAAAREAIVTDDPAARALLTLATRLAVSPFRLSRAFSREMGVSVTRYRNRARVARALDRLEHGEDNLATVAADLGFADQAHLCRTIRQHLDHTPTEVRALLRPTP